MEGSGVPVWSAASAARDSDCGRRGPRRVGQSREIVGPVYLGVPPQFPFVAFDTRGRRDDTSCEIRFR